jgi:hypothetical protein
MVSKTRKSSTGAPRDKVINSNSERKKSSTAEKRDINSSSERKNHQH